MTEIILLVILLLLIMLLAYFMWWTKVPQLIYWNFKTGYQNSVTNQHTVGYRTEDLLDVSALQFEELVAEAWEKRGFRTNVTERQDGGVDVIAERDGDKVGIEAKQWGRKQSVGSPVVRSVYAGARQRGCNRAVVATTASFTEDANSTADELYVDLVGPEQLCEWLNGK